MNTNEAIESILATFERKAEDAARVSDDLIDRIITDVVEMLRYRMTDGDCIADIDSGEYYDSVDQSANDGLIYTSDIIATYSQFWVTNEPELLGEATSITEAMVYAVIESLHDVLPDWEAVAAETLEECEAEAHLLWPSIY